MNPQIRQSEVPLPLNQQWPRTAQNLPPEQGPRPVGPKPGPAQPGGGRRPSRPVGPPRSRHKARAAPRGGPGRQQRPPRARPAPPPPRAPPGPLRQGGPRRAESPGRSRARGPHPHRRPGPLPARQLTRGRAPAPLPGRGGRRTSPRRHRGGRWRRSPSTLPPAKGPGAACTPLGQQPHGGNGCLSPAAGRARSPPHSGPRGAARTTHLRPTLPTGSPAVSQPPPSRWTSCVPVSPSRTPIGGPCPPLLPAPPPHRPDAPGGPPFPTHAWSAATPLPAGPPPCTVPRQHWLQSLLVFAMPAGDWRIAVKARLFPQ